MLFAHILGLPFEELLLPAASSGAMILLALRVWAGDKLRSGRRHGAV